MIVGHDQPAGVDDEPGPEALSATLRGLLAVAATGRAVAVHEVFEELLERGTWGERRYLRGVPGGVSRRHRLGRRDVDHRRQQLFRQIGEALGCRAGHCGRKRESDNRRQRERSHAAQQSDSEERGVGQTHGSDILAGGPHMGTLAYRVIPANDTIGSSRTRDRGCGLEVAKELVVGR